MKLELGAHRMEKGYLIYDNNLDKPDTLSSGSWPYSQYLGVTLPYARVSTLPSLTNSYQSNLGC